MRNFRILLAAELRALSASRGAVLGCLLVSLCAFYAVYYGVDKVAEQRRVISSLPEIQRWMLAETDRKYGGKLHSGDAGYELYHPTAHHPGPFTALAIGQRDVNPYTLDVRLLGIHSQLYDAGIENPLKSVSGNFDLSFVLVFLFPLFLIASSYNVLSEERERGTWALVRSQCPSPGRLLAIKLAVRYALALGLASALLALAVVWSGAPLDGTIASWCLLTATYFAFWIAVILLVVGLDRTSAFNAVTLVALWIVTTVLLPALFNMALVVFYPVPHGQLLTLNQRQVVNAGWDIPKDQTMKAFFQSYPMYGDTAPVTARFAWKWYFAMHQVGDDAVAAEARDYMANLRQRARLAATMSVLAPPSLAQILYNRLAGTELEDHLDYLQSVVAFHDRLEAYFFPLIFREAKFTPADHASLPRHEHLTRSTGFIVPRELVALIVLVVVGVALGYARLKRRELS